MDQYSVPSEAQLAKFMEGNPDKPVAALNLFWFNEHARYQPEDPEFGTDAANVSGREAFAAYAVQAGQAIAELGGYVAFSATVAQVMIGPDELDCDTTAIMVFPSRCAFIQMQSSPKFAESSRHRKAALANHIMLHLDGTSFLS